MQNVVWLCLADKNKVFPEIKCLDGSMCCSKTCSALMEPSQTSKLPEPTALMPPTTFPGAGNVCDCDQGDPEKESEPAMLFHHNFQCEMRWQR